MLVIEVVFSHGSYHATPWGHQVKEGHVEYPPSPWRFLRALLASWYKLSDRPSEEKISDLLAKLSGCLPTYHLPPVDHAHTRQMVPVKPNKERFRSREVYRQEIFDAFYALSEPLYIEWNVELNGDELVLLDQLLQGMSYLGRSESRAELKIVLNGPKSNAYPDADGDTRVLCPGDITSENAISLIGVYTSDLQKERYSGIPGTKWVNYRVKLPTLPRNRDKTPATEYNAPTLVRFAIGARQPIHIRRALPLCDRLHKTLCTLCDSPTITGFHNGKPRMDGNQHAFFVPEVDEFNFIRMVSVYASEGFDSDAIAALAKLPGCLRYLELCLIQVGQPSDYSKLPWWGNAQVWRSLTPLVLPRHPKRMANGKLKDSCEEQIHSMLSWAGIDTPVEVAFLENPVEWQQFVRMRNGDRESRKGWGLELRFSQPVEGNLALGYAAHYGLGRFVRAD